MTVKLNGKVDRENLDSNTVVGLFLYRKPGQEIDIEFSPCLMSEPYGGQFVVQPFTRPGNIKRFRMPSTQKTSHRITWLPERIEFVSWKGWAKNPRRKTTIASWIYTGPDIPPLHDPGTPEEMRFRLNTWTCDGGAPLSGEGNRVVLKSFKFESQQP